MNFPLIRLAVNLVETGGRPYKIVLIVSADLACQTFPRCHCYTECITCASIPAGLSVHHLMHTYLACGMKSAPCCSIARHLQAAALMQQQYNNYRHAS
jgi:hypothetical protein